MKKAIKIILVGLAAAIALFYLVLLITAKP
jgi:hypothetical protein